MPADRPDFGSRLRAAREARGLSLKDIAASTKISTLALEALERNDASRLPGGIFSRSFVRAYAKEVGLDAEQTVREFEQRFSGGGEKVEQEEPIRRQTTANESVSHGTARWVGLIITLVLIAAWIGVDRYFSRQAAAPPRSSTAPKPMSGEALPPPPTAPPMPRVEAPRPPVEQPGSGAPAAQAGQSSQPGPGTITAGSTAPAPTAGVSGTVAPQVSAAPAATAPQGKAQTAPPPLANATPSPVANPPTSVTAPAAALPSAPDDSLPLQVVLAPRADCWVSVSVDGRKMPGRLIKAGEKVHLSAGQSIVLTAGDAGALDYTINNAPGRALGESGQVKTVVINTTNYQGFIAR